MKAIVISNFYEEQCTNAVSKLAEKYETEVIKRYEADKPEAYAKAENPGADVVVMFTDMTSDARRDAAKALARRWGIPCALIEQSMSTWEKGLRPILDKVKAQQMEKAAKAAASPPVSRKPQRPAHFVEPPKELKKELTPVNSNNENDPLKAYGEKVWADTKALFDEEIQTLTVERDAARSELIGLVRVHENCEVEQARLAADLATATNDISFLKNLGELTQELEGKHAKLVAEHTALERQYETITGSRESSDQYAKDMHNKYLAAKNELEATRKASVAEKEKLQKEVRDLRQSETSLAKKFEDLARNATAAERQLTSVVEDRAKTAELANSKRASLEIELTREREAHQKMTKEFERITQSNTLYFNKDREQRGHLDMQAAKILELEVALSKKIPAVGPPAGVEELCRLVTLKIMSEEEVGLKLLALFMSKPAVTSAAEALFEGSRPDKVRNIR